MTKYYRSAESLFDDTWLGRLFNDVMNHLITLWTGNAYWKAPRPPLWARRLMLLLFPVSYVLLLVTIVVWAILWLIVSIPIISAIGIINFYRRRWE